MVLKYTFKTATRALITHKVRSFLTILGIVIGIAAIILVSSVGESANNVIVGELGGLGAETVVIRPGKEPKGPTDIAETLFSDSLKERELEALKKKGNVPDIADISPEILVPGSVSYAGETYKPVILGFSADFMTDTLGLVVSEGASFGEAEIRARSKVAVIGRKVAVELFGNNNPIGEQIQIKNNKFRVVGLFEKRGQVVFFDVDELVLVPYSTAQTYLSGNDYYTQIIARAVSPEKVDGVVYDIKRTLRDLHKIDDPEKDDFYVQTQQGLVEQVESIIGVFTLFLSLVVAVSLVVGGVGIMNIMLVSVTERTKEIGLRKAVGATSKDIMLQFLTEAVILTFAGGLIGVIIGVSLSFMVSVLAKLIAGFALSFVFPIVPALVGIFVSVLVGVVFGIYPAREASKKSPIEALRYE